MSKTNGRRDFLLYASALAGSMALNGCNSFSRGQAVPIAVESLGATTKREIGEKYLHQHSLQQQLMWLGAKERMKVVFRSGSDDAFVSSTVPRNWTEAVMNAKRRKDIVLTGNILATRGTHLLNIKKTSPSPYMKLKYEHITPEVLLGDGLASKYIIKGDRSIQKIIEELNFTPNEFLPVPFIMDKVYGLGLREGIDVFLNVDIKAKMITYSTKPTYINLTPYKRQLFINYLDTRGIGYVTSSKGIAIKDNMTNWIIAMDELSKINKYRYAVYGIFDGKNFFEIADSNYRDSMIVIEMIDWTPDGKREYNIYYNGAYRKVITDRRFLNYYSPDGKVKYLIRFY